MSELKGVMAGAGFFASFHADGWSRVPGVRIAAVADPEVERAAAFAARWGIPAVYAGTDEMLRAEKPDFFDIVTRPDTHLSLARLGAAAGAHVISQKPLAPSLEESREMVEVCERAGVRLLVHENWRWQAWYRELKRLDEAGFFGRIFHLGVQMRTGDGRGTEPYPVQPYFREMPRLLIYETMVHFLDTFRYLAGDLAAVWCRTARVNPLIRGEDYVLIQVDFAGGAHGLIDANRISGQMPPEVAFGTFRLEGERGMALVTPDGRIRLTEYGGTERPHDFTPPQCGYKGDSVHALQQHLRDCLVSGREAESEGRTYLKTVEAVFACYRSAETGEVVVL